MLYILKKIGILFDNFNFKTRKIIFFKFYFWKKKIKEQIEKREIRIYLYLHNYWEKYLNKKKLIKHRCF